MSTENKIIETKYITLAPKIPSKFPATRYQGSKYKIANWIWECIDFLDFETVGDLFGGTGVMSYLFKQYGKTVTYNDILQFNYHTGIALIENSKERIDQTDIDLVLSDNHNRRDKVQKIYKNIFFTDAENEFIDNYICNINQFFKDDKFKYAMLLWCLFQACIIKRPFNLFHRKNLYMRTQDVERSFGNKVTWDRPFTEYIYKFSEEINNSVLDNGKKCISRNDDALELDDDFDLVYIDTPYISQKGTGVDYLNFYHFLEGLCNYDNWESLIDHTRKHKPINSSFNPWNSPKTISQAFADLFGKYRKSHLIISYRSDGIPSIEELIYHLKPLKKNILYYYYGDYKYVLSKNGNSKEVLIVVYD